MKQLNTILYKKMYLIRRVEEVIQALYPEDEMKTPMHMSMGEEAIVVGVCTALQTTDQVLGTWRSHAIYLAKTRETDRFFAEMYGKASGCAGGKAGSMHLSAPDHGLLCCSAIVGSIIPVGMGAAFANQYQKNGRKVAVFFGDGALDTGAFWESLNFACLRKLPILFVCEDNDFAVHTRREDRHGFRSITEVVSKFDCNVFEEDATDAEVIYQMAKDALKAMEGNGMPCLLRFHYYRYLEHVGVNYDFDAGYRSKEEYLPWFERDPVRLQRNKLLANYVSQEELAFIEDEIDEQIVKSIEAAKSAEFACASQVCKGVYGCG